MENACFVFLTNWVRYVGQLTQVLLILTIRREPVVALPTDIAALTDQSMILPYNAGPIYHDDRISERDWPSIHSLDSRFYFRC